MQHDFMDGSFDERVHRAWTEGEWIIDEMFNEGMAFFEGYIPAIDLDRLDVALSQLTEHELDCTYSVWSNDTSETDWNHVYPLPEYIKFFRSGRIHMLDVQYSVNFSTYSFGLKLIFLPDADLEIIFCRENLLPRNETQPRFIAACNYLRHLQMLLGGEALFLGPDTLNYPDWPDTVPPEWQRLN